MRVRACKLGVVSVIALGSKHMTMYSTVVGLAGWCVGLISDFGLGVPLHGYVLLIKITNTWHESVSLACGKLHTA